MAPSRTCAAVVKESLTVHVSCTPTSQVKPAGSTSLAERPPAVELLCVQDSFLGPAAQAADRTKHALATFKVTGIDTGIPFLQTIIDDSEYRAGKVNTRWLEKKLEDYAARYGS